MLIDVLGTPYKLILKNPDNDKALGECGGYRDAYAKEIVVADYEQDKTDPMQTKKIKELVKHNIRHEIIHAFMFESGIDANALNASFAWAKNEEMIDWFAIQGKKIYAAWKIAGAI